MCNAFLSIGRSHVLQADSEVLYQAWMTELQLAIGLALRGSYLNSRTGSQGTDNPASADSNQEKSKYVSLSYPGKYARV